MSSGGSAAFSGNKDAQGFGELIGGAVGISVGAYLASTFGAPVTVPSGGWALVAAATTGGAMDGSLQMGW